VLFALVQAINVTVLNPLFFALFSAPLRLARFCSS
jgi:hypothetical protein